jgi:hypothetical protein
VKLAKQDGKELTEVAIEGGEVAFTNCLASFTCFSGIPLGRLCFKARQSVEVHKKKGVNYGY